MKKIKIKKRTKKTNIKSNDKGNLSAFKRRFKKGNLGEKSPRCYRHAEDAGQDPL